MPHECSQPVSKAVRAMPTVQFRPYWLAAGRDVTRHFHVPSPPGGRAGARPWIFAPAKTSGPYRIRGPAFVGTGQGRAQ